MKAALALLVLLVTSNASAARYAGRPLVDALHDLERRGLHLIYSSEVIQPELTVREEPRSSEPRAILDELLRQHRLHAVPGPRDTLVIIHDEEPRQVNTSKPAPPAMPVAVDQIVVTPSHFGILGSQPEQRQFLSRQDVRATPHFSDDIYRAINRIPGATTNDVSASFNIRGGGQDEVEVLLDGVQIYQPFHVKDLLSAFSMLDAEVMGSVDVLTGGFPAEYGGRLSGVIDIASLTPDERRTEVGVSMLNSRVLSAGTFRDGRGQWLFSFRPGYLHEVLRIVNNQTGLDPSYYDLFGKVQWQLSDATIVSANVLVSHDRLRLNDSDVQAHSRSADEYLWLNARSAITPRLFSQNVISAGSISDHRQGVFVEQNEHGTLSEQRSFRFVTLRNDTTFNLTDRQKIKAGFSMEHVHADYDFVAGAFQQGAVFHGGIPNVIDRDVSLRPSGNDAGAYVADRIAVRPDLVIEAGLRADRESYTPDGTHVMPRLNAGWAVTPSTSIRAAWGRFAQPQRVEELQVEDGVTTYAPAEMATHAILGVDRRLERGWSVRVETYQKHLSHLRPRFENLLDTITMFPEIREDRVRIAPSRGVARGTELLLRRDGDGPWNGWLTLVHSSVRDEIDGRMVPRSWDQRDAIGFSVNYGYPEHWNVNLAGTFHSGWPTTGLTGYTTPLSPTSYALHLVPGPFNGERLPSYRRVDLRASRSIAIGSGRLNFFVDVLNLFNRANTSRVNFTIDVDRNGNVTTVRNTTSIVPLLPSFGIAWQF